MAGIRELLGSSESVGVWRVVPEQSTIGFKSKSMWGLVPVKGRFTEFSGDGQIWRRPNGIRAHRRQGCVVGDRDS
jgi:polyisoprenoid-binding protein YceI